MLFLFLPLLLVALVAASTPAGFTPASTNDLAVTYGQTQAVNGAVVDKGATAAEPTLSTAAALTGSSFAVLMIDLDIPVATQPTTFLHWIQTGLAPARTASTIVTAAGNTQAFTLTNANKTAAVVPYTQPNPPAKNPLSHRYTEILVDTSAMTPEGLQALQAAARTRVGFDVNAALKAAGLADKVVAGNSFNVTNAGPAQAGANVQAGGGGGGGGASGKAGAATGAAGNAAKTGSGAGALNQTGAAKATGAGSNAGGAARASGSPTPTAAKGNSTRGGGSGDGKGGSGGQATSPLGNAPTDAASLQNNATGGGGKGRGNGTVSTSDAMGLPLTGPVALPASLVVGMFGVFVLVL